MQIGNAEKRAGNEAGNAGNEYMVVNDDGENPLDDIQRRFGAIAPFSAKLPELARFSVPLPK